MKKPVWVSFFGWIFALLLGFNVARSMAYMVFKVLLAPRITIGFGLLAAVPCFMLWAVGSLVYTAAHMARRAQADPLLKAGAGSGPAGLAQLAGAGRPAPVPPSAAGRLCSICKINKSVVLCQAHQVELCASCITGHVQRDICSLAVLSDAPPTFYWANLISRAKSIAANVEKKLG